MRKADCRHSPSLNERTGFADLTGAYCMGPWNVPPRLALAVGEEAFWIEVNSPNRITVAWAENLEGA
jgi:hypothetical protein